MENKEFSRLVKNYKELAIDRLRLVDLANKAKDSKPRAIMSEPVAKTLYRDPSHISYDGASIGVSVAKYESDKTCFVVMRCGFIELVETWSESDAAAIAGKILNLMGKYHVALDRVGVDYLGYGGGVADILSKLNIEVEKVFWGNKPIPCEEFEYARFLNLRAQVFWALKEDTLKRHIGGLEYSNFAIDDEVAGWSSIDVLKELSRIKVIDRDDYKLSVTSMLQYKDEYGHSPTIADALAICNWVRRKQ